VPGITRINDGFEPVAVTFDEIQRALAGAAQVLSVWPMQFLVQV